MLAKYATMSSKSKTKGSNFERAYSAFLSELFGSPFIRVPNSGAFVGGKNIVRKAKLDENQAKTFKGDIIAPDTWVNWNCECKSYADFPFHQLFSGEVKILDTWIEQCLVVADENDFSFIAFKINRKGTFIAVKKYHADMKFINNFTYNSEKNGEWIIMDSSEFWQMNADVVRSVCEELKEKSKINA